MEARPGNKESTNINSWPKKMIFVTRFYVIFVGMNIFLLPLKAIKRADILNGTDEEREVVIFPFTAPSYTGYLYEGVEGGELVTPYTTTHDEREERGWGNLNEEKGGGFINLFSGISLPPPILSNTTRHYYYYYDEIIASLLYTAATPSDTSQGAKKQRARSRDYIEKRYIRDWLLTTRNNNLLHPPDQDPRPHNHDYYRIVKGHKCKIVTGDGENLFKAETTPVVLVSPPSPFLPYAAFGAQPRRGFTRIVIRVRKSKADQINRERKNFYKLKVRCVTKYFEIGVVNNKSELSPPSSLTSPRAVGVSGSGINDRFPTHAAVSAPSLNIGIIPSGSGNATIINDDDYYYYEEKNLNLLNTSNNTTLITDTNSIISEPDWYGDPPNHSTRWRRHSGKKGSVRRGGSGKIVGKTSESFCSFSIHILDKNELRPMFEQSGKAGYTLELNDSTPTFMPLLTIKAYDTDDGYNGQVVYRLSQYVPGLSLEPGGVIYLTSSPRQLFHNTRASFNQAFKLNVSDQTFYINLSIIANDLSVPRYRRSNSIKFTIFYRKSLSSSSPRVAFIESSRDQLISNIDLGNFYGNYFRPITKSIRLGIFSVTYLPYQNCDLKSLRLLNYTSELEPKEKEEEIFKLSSSKQATYVGNNHDQKNLKYLIDFDFRLDFLLVKPNRFIDFNIIRGVSTANGIIVPFVKISIESICYPDPTLWYYYTSIDEHHFSDHIKPLTVQKTYRIPLRRLGNFMETELVPPKLKITHLIPPPLKEDGGNLIHQLTPENVPIFDVSKKLLFPNPFGPSSCQGSTGYKIVSGNYDGLFSIDRHSGIMYVTRVDGEDITGIGNNNFRRRRDFRLSAVKPYMKIPLTPPKPPSSTSVPAVLLRVYEIGIEIRNSFSPPGRLILRNKHCPMLSRWLFLNNRKVTDPTFPKQLKHVTMTSVKFKLTQANLHYPLFLTGTADTSYKAVDFFVFRSHPNSSNHHGYEGNALIFDVSDIVIDKDLDEAGELIYTLHVLNDGTAQTDAPPNSSNEALNSNPLFAIDELSGKLFLNRTAAKSLSFIKDVEGPFGFIDHLQHNTVITIPYLLIITVSDLGHTPGRLFNELILQINLKGKKRNRANTPEKNNTAHDVGWTSANKTNIYRNLITTTKFKVIVDNENEGAGQFPPQRPPRRYRRIILFDVYRDLLINLPTMFQSTGLLPGNLSSIVNKGEVGKLRQPYFRGDLLEFDDQIQKLNTKNNYDSLASSFIERTVQGRYTFVIREGNDDRCFTIDKDEGKLLILSKSIESCFPRSSPTRYLTITMVNPRNRLFINLSYQINSNNNHDSTGMSRINSSENNTADDEQHFNSVEFDSGRFASYLGEEEDHKNEKKANYYYLNITLSYDGRGLTNLLKDSSSTKHLLLKECLLALKTTLPDLEHVAFIVDRHVRNENEQTTRGKEGVIVFDVPDSFGGIEPGKRFVAHGLTYLATAVPSVFPSIVPQTGNKHYKHLIATDRTNRISIDRNYLASLSLLTPSSTSNLSANFVIHVPLIVHFYQILKGDQPSSYSSWDDRKGEEDSKFRCLLTVHFNVRLHYWPGQRPAELSRDVVNTNATDISTTIRYELDLYAAIFIKTTPSNQTVDLFPLNLETQWNVTQAAASLTENLASARITTIPNCRYFTVKSLINGPEVPFLTFHAISFKRAILYPGKDLEKAMLKLTKELEFRISLTSGNRTTSTNVQVKLINLEAFFDHYYYNTFFRVKGGVPTLNPEIPKRVTLKISADQPQFSIVGKIPVEHDYVSLSRNLAEILTLSYRVRRMLGFLREDTRSTTSLRYDTFFNQRFHTVIYCQPWYEEVVQLKNPNSNLLRANNTNTTTLRSRRMTRNFVRHTRKKATRRSTTKRNNNLIINYDAFEHDALLPPLIIDPLTNHIVLTENTLERVRANLASSTELLSWRYNVTRSLRCRNLIEGTVTSYPLKNDATYKIEIDLIEPKYYNYYPPSVVQIVEYFHPNLTTTTDDPDKSNNDTTPKQYALNTTKWYYDSLQIHFEPAERRVCHANHDRLKLPRGCSNANEELEVLRIHAIDPDHFNDDHKHHPLFKVVGSVGTDGIRYSLLYQYKYQVDDITEILNKRTQYSGIPDIFYSYKTWKFLEIDDLTGVLSVRRQFRDFPRGSNNHHYVSDESRSETKSIGVYVKIVDNIADKRFRPLRPLMNWPDASYIKATILPLTLTFIPRVNDTEFSSDVLHHLSGNIENNPENAAGGVFVCQIHDYVYSMNVNQTKYGSPILQMKMVSSCSNERGTNQLGHSVPEIHVINHMIDKNHTTMSNSSSPSLTFSLNGIDSGSFNIDAQGYMRSSIIINDGRRRRRHDDHLKKNKNHIKTIFHFNVAIIENNQVVVDTIPLYIVIADLPKARERDTENHSLISTHNEQNVTYHQIKILRELRPLTFRKPMYYVTTAYSNNLVGKEIFNFASCLNYTNVNDKTSQLKFSEISPNNPFLTLEERTGKLILGHQDIRNYTKSVVIILSIKAELPGRGVETTIPALTRLIVRILPQDSHNAFYSTSSSMLNFTRDRVDLNVPIQNVTNYDLLYKFSVKTTFPNSTTTNDDDLRYVIQSGNYHNLFTVDTKSGELTLNTSRLNIYSSSPLSEFTKIYFPTYQLIIKAFSKTWEHDAFDYAFVTVNFKGGNDPYPVLESFRSNNNEKRLLPDESITNIFIQLSQSDIPVDDDTFTIIKLERYLALPPNTYEYLFRNDIDSAADTVHYSIDKYDGTVLIPTTNLGPFHRKLATMFNVPNCNDVLDEEGENCFFLLQRFLDQTLAIPPIYVQIMAGGIGDDGGPFHTRPPFVATTTTFPYDATTIIMSINLTLEIEPDLLIYNYLKGIFETNLRPALHAVSFKSVYSLAWGQRPKQKLYVRDSTTTMDYPSLGSYLSSFLFKSFPNCQTFNVTSNPMLMAGANLNAILPYFTFKLLPDADDTGTNKERSKPLPPLMKITLEDSVSGELSLTPTTDNYDYIRCNCPNNSSPFPVIAVIALYYHNRFSNARLNFLIELTIEMNSFSSHISSSQDPALLPPSFSFKSPLLLLESEETVILNYPIVNGSVIYRFEGQDYARKLMKKHPAFGGNCSTCVNYLSSHITWSLTSTSVTSPIKLYFYDKKNYSSMSDTNQGSMNLIAAFVAREKESPIISTRELNDSNVYLIGKYQGSKLIEVQLRFIFVGPIADDITNVFTFEKLDYHLKIWENGKNLTYRHNRLLRLNTVGLFDWFDTSLRGEVRYEILEQFDETPFSIDYNGILKCGGANEGEAACMLDAELKSRYTFVAKASACLSVMMNISNLPSKQCYSAYTYLHVEVLDLNDNQPKFADPSLLYFQNSAVLEIRKAVIPKAEDNKPISNFFVLTLKNETKKSNVVQVLAYDDDQSYENRRMIFVLHTVSDSYLCHEQPNGTILEDEVPLPTLPNVFFQIDRETGILTIRAASFKNDPAKIPLYLKYCLRIEVRDDPSSIEVYRPERQFLNVSVLVNLMPVSVQSFKLPLFHGRFNDFPPFFPSELCPTDFVNVSSKTNAVGSSIYRFPNHSIPDLYSYYNYGDEDATVITRPLYSLFNLNYNDFNDSPVQGVVPFKLDTFTGVLYLTHAVQEEPNQIFSYTRYQIILVKFLHDRSMGPEGDYALLNDCRKLVISIEYYLRLPPRHGGNDTMTTTGGGTLIDPTVLPIKKNTPSMSREGGRKLRFVNVQEEPDGIPIYFRIPMGESTRNDSNFLLYSFQVYYLDDIVNSPSPPSPSSYYYNIIQVVRAQNNDPSAATTTVVTGIKINARTGKLYGNRDLLESLLLLPRGRQGSSSSACALFRIQVSVTDGTNYISGSFFFLLDYYDYYNVRQGIDLDPYCNNLPPSSFKVDSTNDNTTVYQRFIRQKRNIREGGRPPVLAMMTVVPAVTPYPGVIVRSSTVIAPSPSSYESKGVGVAYEIHVGAEILLLTSYNLSDSLIPLFDIPVVEEPPTSAPRYYYFTALFEDPYTSSALPGEHKKKEEGGDNLSFLGAYFIMSPNNGTLFLTSFSSLATLLTTTSSRRFNLRVRVSDGVNVNHALISITFSRLIDTVLAFKHNDVNGGPAIKCRSETSASNVSPTTTLVYEIAENEPVYSVVGMVDEKPFVIPSHVLDALRKGMAAAEGDDLSHYYEITHELINNPHQDEKVDERRVVEIFSETLVRLRRTLDYERERSYEYTLKSVLALHIAKFKDKEGVGLMSHYNPQHRRVCYTKLVVNVIDVNDNVPRFVDSPSIIDVSLLADATTEMDKTLGPRPIAQVIAVDADSIGPNSRVTYALADDLPETALNTIPPSYFSIDSISGELLTTFTTLPLSVLAPKVASVACGGGGKDSSFNYTEKNVNTTIARLQQRQVRVIASDQGFPPLTTYRDLTVRFNINPIGSSTLLCDAENNAVDQRTTTITHVTNAAVSSNNISITGHPLYSTTTTITPFYVITGQRTSILDPTFFGNNCQSASPLSQHLVVLILVDEKISLHEFVDKVNRSVENSLRVCGLESSRPRLRKNDHQSAFFYLVTQTPPRSILITRTIQVSPRAHNGSGNVEWYMNNLVFRMKGISLADYLSDVNVQDSIIDTISSYGNFDVDYYRVSLTLFYPPKTAAPSIMMPLPIIKQQHQRRFKRGERSTTIVLPSFLTKGSVPPLLYDHNDDGYLLALHVWEIYKGQKAYGGYVSKENLTRALILVDITTTTSISGTNGTTMLHELQTKLSEYYNSSVTLELQPQICLSKILNGHVKVDNCDHNSQSNSILPRSQEILPISTTTYPIFKTTESGGTLYPYVTIKSVDTHTDNDNFIITNLSRNYDKIIPVIIKPNNLTDNHTTALATLNKYLSNPINFAKSFKYLKELLCDWSTKYNITCPCDCRKNGTEKLSININDEKYANRSNVHHHLRSPPIRITMTSKLNVSDHKVPAVASADPNRIINGSFSHYSSFVGVADKSTKSSFQKLNQELPGGSKTTWDKNGTRNNLGIFGGEASWMWTKTRRRIKLYFTIPCLIVLLFVTLCVSFVYYCRWYLPGCQNLKGRRAGRRDLHERKQREKKYPGNHDPADLDDRIYRKTYYPRRHRSGSNNGPEQQHRRYKRASQRSLTSHVDGSKCGDDTLHLDYETSSLLLDRSSSYEDSRRGHGGTGTNNIRTTTKSLIDNNRLKGGALHEYHQIKSLGKVTSNNTLQQQQDSPKFSFLSKVVAARRTTTSSNTTRKPEIGTVKETLNDTPMIKPIVNNKRLRRISPSPPQCKTRTINNQTSKSRCHETHRTCKTTNNNISKRKNRKHNTDAVSVPGNETVILAPLLQNYTIVRNRLKDDDTEDKSKSIGNRLAAYRREDNQKPKHHVCNNQNNQSSSSSLINDDENTDKACLYPNVTESKKNQSSIYVEEEEPNPPRLVKSADKRDVVIDNVITNNNVRVTRIKISDDVIEIDSAKRGGSSDTKSITTPLNTCFHLTATSGTQTLKKQIQSGDGHASKRPPGGQAAASSKLEIYLNHHEDGGPPIPGLSTDFTGNIAAACEKTTTEVYETTPHATSADFKCCGLTERPRYNDGDEYYPEYHQGKYHCRPDCHNSATHHQSERETLTGTLTDRQIVSKNADNIIRHIARDEIKRMSKQLGNFDIFGNGEPLYFHHNQHHHPENCKLNNNNLPVSTNQSQIIDGFISRVHCKDNNGTIMGSIDDPRENLFKEFTGEGDLIKNDLIAANNILKPSPLMTHHKLSFKESSTTCNKENKIVRGFASINDFQAVLRHAKAFSNQVLPNKSHYLTNKIEESTTIQLLADESVNKLSSIPRQFDTLNPPKTIKNSTRHSFSFNGLPKRKQR